MSIFNKILGKNKSKRIFVLGIDGTPFTFIEKLMNEGKFPNFKRLTEKGSFRRMNSVVPCISSVAWTSFLTGTNLAKHNIQGFVDRTLNPFSVFIPTAKNISVPTVSEMLGSAGKRVVSINVPVSYPPKEVNGVQISCFLATDLAKAVYPQEYYSVLKNMGYRIDVDAWQARKDKEKFLEDIHYTFDKRVEAAYYLMEKENWDYFQLHIMETDRINHFLWEHWEMGDKQYAPEFEKFYQRLDELIGDLDKKLGEDVEFIVLSDHGFCTIKKEVYLNHWLEKNGYLKYKTENPKAITEMHPDSKAYSLIPGRIYINLKGREDDGVINPGDEYEALRAELIEKMMRIKDPDSGEQIIRKVYKREELFNGPFYDATPDLIAVPFNGYDLKGNINQPQLTFKGELVGMHTDDDATFYIRNRQVTEQPFSIIDVLPSILELMALELPEAVNFDGKSILMKK